MMFSECITISDEEDEVEVLETLVHIDTDPVIIDLTSGEGASQNQDQERFSKSQTGFQTHSQPPPPPPPQPATEKTAPSPPASQPKPSPPPPSPPKPSQQHQPDPPQPTWPSQPPNPPQSSQPPHHPPFKHQPFSNHQPRSNHHPPSDHHPPSNNHPVSNHEAPNAPNQDQAPLTTTDQTSQQENDSRGPQQTISDQELLAIQKRLGNEKYRNNLFDDAIRIYKRAILLATKLDNKEMSAILHFNLAMTYDKLKYYERAVDECTNAVKFNSSYLKAHQKRADIYLSQKKYDEAVICYEHLCELDSNNQYFVQCLNAASHKAKQTRKKDCFEILGLNSNFTREDVKKAYRRSALLHHPDRHSDADIVTRRIHEKLFKDAAEAYSYMQLKFGY